MQEYRNFSKQLSFDFNDIDAARYSYITDTIVKNYDLKEASKLVRGFDEIFQEFKTDEKVVGLEWDIWSGYMVIAKNTDSEKLARDIANFINDLPRNH